MLDHLDRLRWRQLNHLPSIIQALAIQMMVALWAMVEVMVYATGWSLDAATMVLLWGSLASLLTRLLLRTVRLHPIGSRFTLRTFQFCELGFQSRDSLLLFRDPLILL